MLIELGHYLIIISLFSTSIGFFYDFYRIFLNIILYFLENELPKILIYLKKKSKYLKKYIEIIANDLLFKTYYQILYNKRKNLFIKINSNIFIYIPKISFLCLWLGFLCLFYSYITSDFSLINIIKYSHSIESLIYKICGLWGNQEGSMMLWCWILLLYSFILSIISSHDKSLFFFKILNIQTYSIFFFILFTVFASNPFLRGLYFFSNGMELNPILQDPTLALHPPFLYLGYLGFSIGFSIAFVILKEKYIPYFWIYYMKLFTLFSWCLLTFGIGLGSWWAYYELGWGGWWFWDPVENISLIPWLLGTALLHNFIVNENGYGLNHWTLSLAILIFLLSLMGTFFVRSGLLVSVHSFANDSISGLFIFFYLIFLILFIIYNYKNNHNYLFQFIKFYLISKENVIRINNIFFIFMSFIVFLGISLPIILSFFLLKQVSLGPNFYNEIFIPLMIPFIIFISFGPLVIWRGDKVYSFLNFQNFSFGFIFYYLLEISLYEKINSLLSFIIILLILWLFINLFILMSHIKKINGMLISHLGIGIFIFSIAFNLNFQSSFMHMIHPGEIIKFENYNFIFRNLHFFEINNYKTLIFNFLIKQQDYLISVIFPEQRFYSLKKILSFKPSINTNFLSDIYILLGDGNLELGWYMKIIFNPLIIGIWIGILLVSLGSLISMRKLNYKIMNPLYF